MGNFNEINTKGVDLKQAIDVATRSENSRDFSPTLNGFTVGLSTGTSGNKGLFLVSKKERAMWVALILQRIIGWEFRKRKIAFFLRANSNLYTSVQSKLLAFNFFDLLDPIDQHLSRIDKLQPNIIVGQPSLLILLAKAQKNEDIKLSALIKSFPLRKYYHQKTKKLLKGFSKFVFNKFINVLKECSVRVAKKEIFILTKMD